MRSHSYEIRSYEIPYASTKYEVVSRNYEIASRNYEIVKHTMWLTLASVYWKCIHFILIIDTYNSDIFIFKNNSNYPYQ